jgi:hypothetical protein
LRSADPTIHRCAEYKSGGWLTRVCSGAGPSPAPLGYRDESGNGKQKKTALGRQRAREVRDGISRGRESGRSDAFGAGEIVLLELPDGTRQSIGIPPLSLTSPSSSLRVARLSVGMTGFGFYPISAGIAGCGKPQGLKPNFVGPGTARVNLCPDTLSCLWTRGVGATLGGPFGQRSRSLAYARDGRSRGKQRGLPDAQPRGVAAPHKTHGTSGKPINRNNANLREINVDIM